MHTLSVNMAWAEQLFIMEAIDNFQPAIVREGGRIVWSALFESCSWEEEWKRVITCLLHVGGYAQYPGQVENQALSES